MDLDFLNIYWLGVYMYIFLCFLILIKRIFRYLIYYNSLYFINLEKVGVFIYPFTPLTEEWDMAGRPVNISSFFWLIVGRFVLCFIYCFFSWLSVLLLLFLISPDKKNREVQFIINELKTKELNPIEIRKLISKISLKTIYNYY